MMDKLNFDTLAVRVGSLRTEFNEHSEALPRCKFYWWNAAET